jgi:hypothetical protein
MPSSVHLEDLKIDIRTLEVLKSFFAGGLLGGKRDVVDLMRNLPTVQSQGTYTNLKSEGKLNRILNMAFCVLWLRLEKYHIKPRGIRMYLTVLITKRLHYPYNAFILFIVFPTTNSTGNVSRNVTLRRVRLNIVPWRSNRYYIKLVYVYSLRFQACTVHSPYYIAICGLHVSTSIFSSHYLKNGTIFENSLLNLKCVF